MCSTPPKSGKRGGGVSNDGECDEIPLFRKGSPVVAQGVNGDDANDIDVDVEGGGEDRQEEVEKSRASPTPGALSAQPTVRRSKRRLRIVDNYGDDSDYGLPEEESESEDEKLNVTAARRVSSKKPKCGGGDPWAKKLKKPITIDTDEKLSLNELVTDLEVGVTTTYDGRKISEEVNELAVEYVQSKLDRPEEEQSLLALIGQKGALTTEQRLAVDKMMRKPELGRLLRDIKASAPEGLHNRVVDVRVMLRPKDAGMVPHRDSINLKYDRTVSTWLAGPSQKPPLFFVKLMSRPDATPARGPYEPGEIVVPKVNGRIVVKGPNARGEEVRVVHGVGPGDVTSLTLVADYITTRKDGQPTSDEDRHSARKSVVAHTTRAPPPGATVNPYADGLVWPENAPRTPGSRRATEANNAMVYHDGKMVKKAVVKGMNSGGGGNQTGNAGWSGAGHAARDFSAEGAGERYFGLHLKVPADKLPSTLRRLVQEDGSLLEPLPPLCGIDVSPGFPGVTKAKGTFGLDEGMVVLRVHNSNKPNVCVSEGAIPVTTRKPPFKVPAFAIGPLRAGRVIIRNQNNANALKKNKKN